MRASILAIRRYLALALIALMVLSGSLASAQERPDNMDRGRALLVADSGAQPGKAVDVALVFQPDEGWHGYWSNPGDAGQGVTLDWDLPEGWSVGEPQFPVPHQLLIGGLMNHVYEGEHAVLVPLSVPAAARAGETYPITVRGQWLTCSDVLCVPQWATLRASVTLRKTDRAAASPFAAWRSKIPPLLASTASFETKAGMLRVAIPLPAGLALPDPHVFISNERLVQYAAPQVFRRDGDVLVAEIPLSENGETPGVVEGILAFSKDEGVRFVAEAGDVAKGGTLVAGQPKELPNFWLLILGALAGGLLLNIMPCVFPILSLKALTLARAGESQSQARAEAMAYTAGVMIACVALGAIMLALRAAGEQVGWAFQLQEPAVVVALLVLVLAITANLAGLFELPALSITRKGEPASAFSTGLLAAFVATPCTGPFMAAALGAALLLPPIQALTLFAMLGLGLAFPFLAIGFIPAVRALLPKPGAWMEAFRKFMAIPMGLTALALVWLTWRLGGAMFAFFAVCQAIVLIASLSWAVQERRKESGKDVLGYIAAAATVLFTIVALPDPKPPVANASHAVLASTPYSEQALANARARGAPVFLYFTADWCVTCKLNEQVAIEREATREAFEQADVTVLRGDWTRHDEAITRFLTAQGVAGVPLYLWYDPGQPADQLPQILSPNSLVDRAGNGTRR